MQKYCVFMNILQASIETFDFNIYYLLKYTRSAKKGAFLHEYTSIRIILTTTNTVCRCTLSHMLLHVLFFLQHTSSK
jgi:hypothetical protein